MAAEPLNGVVQTCNQFEWASKAVTRMLIKVDLTMWLLSPIRLCVVMVALGGSEGCGSSGGGGDTDSGISCYPEGADFDARFGSADCCQGLKRIDFMARQIDGRCNFTLPPSAKLCAQCGNGQCGTAENDCNCPVDCPSP